MLAAGRGTRMGGLTDMLPKPMLPLAGKPMLEHVLDRLRAAGSRRVLLVVGYRREQIERHFSGYPLVIDYRVQHSPEGTGHAALLAREFAGDEPFLLTFGDILAEPSDYLAIASRLAADPSASGAAGVKWVDDPCQGAAVYESAGVVTRLVEKPPAGSSTTHWNSAGLYAFRPVIFDYLVRLKKSPRGEYELTSAVSDLVKAGGRLLLSPMEGAWRDVGKPEDLPEAEKLL